MSKLDIACLFLGIGLCIGMWVTQLLWRVKVRDTVKYGLRLEVGGRLYDISKTPPRPDPSAGERTP